MSGYYSHPNRRTVRVRIPRALLDLADQLAEEREIDRALLLGDLVAFALPDALADAARALLQHPASGDADRGTVRELPGSGGDEGARSP
jgi:hypothetical protein